MMKVLLTLSLLSAFAGPNPRFKAEGPAIAASANVISPVKPVPQYKTYKQWKESQLKYWETHGQGQMAKELTVADYFAGYLTKQKNQAEAIKQVSRLLSADEVAELMTVYANSAFGTQPHYLPVQADNLSK